MATTVNTYTVSLSLYQNWIDKKKEIYIINYTHRIWKYTNTPLELTTMVATTKQLKMNTQKKKQQRRHCVRVEEVKWNGVLLCIHNNIPKTATSKTIATNCQLERPIHAIDHIHTHTHTQTDMQRHECTLLWLAGAAVNCYSGSTLKHIHMHRLSVYCCIASHTHSVTTVAQLAVHSF